MLLGWAQQIDPKAQITDNQLRLAVDAKPVRRGKTIRAKVHLLDDVDKRQAFADLVRTAHQKLIQLNMSPLDPEQHCHMKVPNNDWTKRRIPVGMLAPDIQKALLQGTAPTTLDPDRLLSADMPLNWGDQRRFRGMASE